VKDDAQTIDKQLIDRALGGEQAAFGQLVTKYQDRLYNTLVHVVGSADTAYDVVQDAFVQAYVKLETFERASAFYTWLYRIAFNLAMTRRRREKPSVSVEQAREDSGHEPLDHSDPPEARMEQAERAGQVQAALAALSEEHRTILVLREVDGCAYEQIAEILNLPIGTIRSRLYRARLQLRDQLQGVLQEDEVTPRVRVEPN
jgi:RNA polymerase sigma-70 factor (ECF subfamily)